MGTTDKAQLGNIIKLPGRDGRYVVERAELEGGGIGHHADDKYPNGWHVTARRLNEDLSYNETNPYIDFYQSGEFDTAQVLMFKTIRVIGQMNRTFVEPTVTEPAVEAPPLVVEDTPEIVPEPPEDAPEESDQAADVPDFYDVSDEAVEPSDEGELKDDEVL